MIVHVNLSEDQDRELRERLARKPESTSEIVSLIVCAAPDEVLQPRHRLSKRLTVHLSEAAREKIENFKGSSSESVRAAILWELDQE